MSESRQYVAGNMSVMSPKLANAWVEAFDRRAMSLQAVAQEETCWPSPAQSVALRRFVLGIKPLVDTDYPRSPEFAISYVVVSSIR